MMPTGSNPRMTVELEREEEIALLAESLATDAFGYGYVDPIELIEQAGDITLSCGSYGDAFDGLLEYDGSGFHIFANEERFTRLDEGRGAFTLGHELGHYYIDEHRLWMEANPGESHPSFLFSAETNGVPHEREADIFASNLVMPRISFRRFVRSPAPGAEVIVATAEHFRCSRTSTAIRFCELEPFPCAIIRWSGTGEFLWGRMSARVKATYGSLARNLSGIRGASLTAEAIAKGVGAESHGRRPTVSEAWFPWAEERSMRKGARLEHHAAIIDEHVIPLGQYGCLTLLCGHAWSGLPFATHSVPRS